MIGYLCDRLLNKFVEGSMWCLANNITNFDKLGKINQSDLACFFVEIVGLYGLNGSNIVIKMPKCWEFWCIKSSIRSHE